MVCDSCQSKLSKLAVPERGSGRAAPGSGGAVKTGTNKALQLRKAGQWIPEKTDCKSCGGKSLANMKYCNNCAHKKGICAMCGKQAVDVSSHRMSLH